MSSNSQTTIATMLLAGDVGGTKTHVGVFDPGERRPSAIHTATFRTLDFADLISLVRTFLEQARVDARSLQAACFGVAGPVANQRATLTNVPWDVDAAVICAQLPV